MTDHDFQLTKHAVMRMAQRGITNDDVELLESIGTEVEGGYFFREKDFQEFERQLKLLRDRAKRLVGKRLVIEGKFVVTAYPTNRRKERQLLRRN